MASITNSLFPPISPTTNTRTQQFPITNRKRRPVDPPGEEACNGECYKPAGIQSNHTPNKRMKTVDNSLASLSLRAADPPGHDLTVKSLGKAANDNAPMDRMVDSQPSIGVASLYSAAGTNDTSTSCATAITTNKLSIPNKTTQYQNLSSINTMQQYRRREQSSSGITDTGNSEMSLEGSDIESDDSLDSSSGSVSESSIQNSMYQVVFGRMKGSKAGGGGANYDVVDAKIEDLIRRSRMEAVLKSTKEKEPKEPEEEEEEEVAKSMDLG